MRESRAIKGSGRRRAAWAAGIGVALLLLAVFARHSLIGFVLQRGLSLATGYEVRFGAQRLGREHGAFFDVHVSKRGEPVLDAARVDISYQLRDIFPGGQHRFGFASLALTGPIISIIRHADGTYNFTSGGSAASAPGATQAAAAPYFFTVRVRDGTIRLIDRAPISKDLAEQEVNRVAIDASVKSDTRTTATMSGVLIGKRVQDVGLERWPLRARALIDYDRGIALHSLRATALPLRGMLGFLIHSAAFHIDDGVLHDVDVKLYAVDIKKNVPFDYHLGGGAVLTGGRLATSALLRPVRALSGRLDVVENGLWTRGLRAQLGTAALSLRGGVYDWQRLRVRLGIRGDGDLAELRGLFLFSKMQPVAGATHIETLLEAPLEHLLVRTAFAVPRARYAGLPLTNVGGIVDYYDATVVLSGIRANYGAAQIHVGGRFLVGGPDVDTEIALAAAGRGAAIPYAENVVPEADVDAVALITGLHGYRARGAISARGAGDDGYGFFNVNERGVGEFGPFAFARNDGSSVLGALRLERPISQSAGWLSAQNYRVDVPKNGALLPGLMLPGFPPIAGVLSGDLAGGGTPSSFGLAGRVLGRDLHVAQIALGAGSATLGGTLADVRIGDIAVTGPRGRFGGAGSVSNGTFVLEGTYDGSLEALAPLTGQTDAYGSVHGPVRALIDQHDIVVQTAGAALTHARVKGVALDAAAGTIAVRDGRLHVLAAHADIGATQAVAAESDGTVSVWAPDVSARALRGTGLPLQAGNVSIFGRADLRTTAPKFDGFVTVAHGRAAGISVTGDAHVTLDGTRAAFANGTGALGATYGTFAGAIDGIGARALRYDIEAGVPLGDIGLLRRDLRIPVKYLEGSFDAQLRVSGTGTRPLVAGDVHAAEGSYNGLAFRDARARVAIDSFGVSAQNGAFTVGGTRAAVDASVAGRAFSVSARSRAADLADFNDYFDESETLQGHGPLDVAFRTDGGRITTHGDVMLSDVRFRRFPFGATHARWSMNGDAIHAAAGVRGKAGTVETAATIVPSGGDPVRAFTTGRYDGSARLAGIDLNTWLPAAGFQAPILGSVDADARFNGRFPRLGVSGDLRLSDATIAGFGVKSASLRAAAAGTRVAITSAQADLGFVQLTAKGSLGFGETDPLALDVHASTADAGRALHVIAPQTRALDIAGKLDADIRIAGTLFNVMLEGGFDLVNARYRSLMIPRAVGVAALAGNAVSLRDTEVIFTTGQAFVAGSLPLQLQPFGIGPSNAPLSFDVTARGVDLAQFAPLVPGGTKLAGTIDGRFGVEGDVEHPRLLGTLALTNGSYLSDLERAPIANVNARLAFAGTSVALRAFHANLGGGTLDGEGRLDLPFAHSVAAGYAVDLRAQKARLDFPAFGRGTVDGSLRLTSGTPRPLISGDVALSDAVIPFAAISRSGGTAAGETPGPPPLDPAFRIHAVAGRNVRVRNSIVDIGATGSVDLSGTFTQPRLAGAFTSTGGTVSTYNHAFRVQSATVTFDPAAGVVPDINVRAVTHVTNPDPDPTRNVAGSADIAVTVSGPADNYTIAYASNPPYSEAQIVALLFDLPAVLGGVNFNAANAAATLRGAPGETNVLLPPGVSPQQIGTISFNQEVFSLLNGQFTQRALSPLEDFLARVFGLTDLSFTVDYSGGVGYTLRRQIGKRDFYAFLGQTLSFPERTNTGFELRPDPFTTVNFSYFRQNGITSLVTTDTPGRYSVSSSRRLNGFAPLGDRTGFTFTVTKRYP
ncbi:MAG: hypothetical protein NVSMB64_05190 [Candidatus Velthaea sp.]